MVKFKSSLTEGPTVNTDKPVKSLMNFGGYMVGIAILFAGIVLGRTIVEPLVYQFLDLISGGYVSPGEEQPVEVF